MPPINTKSQCQLPIDRWRSFVEVIWLWETGRQTLNRNLGNSERHQVHLIDKKYYGQEDWFWMINKYVLSCLCVEKIIDDSVGRCTGLLSPQLTWSSNVRCACAEFIYLWENIQINQIWGLIRTLPRGSMVVKKSFIFSKVDSKNFQWKV